MTFEESMQLIKKRWWSKTQEEAGYLDFKRERRRREWYVTEGGRRVRWNVYAMDLKREMVDSVGFLLLGPVQKND